MALGSDVVGELDDSALLTSGEYEDVTGSVSFGVERTPNEDTSTLVALTATTYSTGGTEARVEVEVDSGNGFVTRSVSATLTNAGALTSDPDAADTETSLVYVSDGSTYRIVNVSDPNGTNAIEMVHEVSL